MRSLGFILCLAGCNGVFGLEPTISIDATAATDIDGDGITDEGDNCPTLANPAQENRDGDAFGDACDTCPDTASASTHDEDRDHLGDDCDVCPGKPDFQRDADSDGVGDLCDPGSGTNQRLVFETFVAEPSGWQSDTIHWTTTQDTIAPDATLPPSDQGLRNLSIQTSGVWKSEIGVESTLRWKGGEELGLIAKSASHTVTCAITCSTIDDKCSGRIVFDGSTGPVRAFPARPYIRISLASVTTGRIDCSFDENTSAAFLSGDGLAISVLASPNARIAYFEHIQ